MFYFLLLYAILGLLFLLDIRVIRRLKAKNNHLHHRVIFLQDRLGEGWETRRKLLFLEDRLLEIHKLSDPRTVLQAIEKTLTTIEVKSHDPSIPPKEVNIPAGPVVFNEVGQDNCSQ